MWVLILVALAVHGESFAMAAGTFADGDDCRVAAAIAEQQQPSQVKVYRGGKLSVVEVIGHSAECVYVARQRAV